MIFEEDYEKTALGGHRLMVIALFGGDFYLGLLRRTIISGSAYMPNLPSVGRVISTEADRTTRNLLSPNCNYVMMSSPDSNRESLRSLEMIKRVEARMHAAP